MGHEAVRVEPSWRARGRRILVAWFAVSVAAFAYAQVVDVSVGRTRSYFVDASGNVFESSSVAVPTRVWWLSNVTSVSAGGHHALARRRNGTVAAWGSGSSGQLGQPSSSDVRRVEQVQFPEGVRLEAVAAGYDFSIALTSHGHVYAWGSNRYGQLGDGTTTDRHEPARVAMIEDAVAIAAGQYHALALLRHGTVVAWGRNGDGQLGIGTYEGFETTPAPLEFSWELRWIIGDGDVPIVRVIAASATADHSAAILDDGSVVTWGANRHAQLGNGSRAATAWADVVPGVERAVAVAVGESNTYAVLQGGTVVAWASNDYGQLGDGSLRHRAGPTTVARIDDAVSVAAGRMNAIVVRADGSVMAWGRNGDGELGTGDQVDRVVPERVVGWW